MTALVRCLVRLLLVAAVASAALAPPSASAQAALDSSVSVVIDSPTSALPPSGGILVASGHVHYHYPSLGALPGSSTTIRLEVVEQPPWAVVTLSPRTLVVPTSPTMGPEAVAEFALVASVTWDAPAFEPGEVRVAAFAEENGLIEPSRGESSIVVTADYFALLKATAPADPVALKPGRSASADVLVENLGNGVTRVDVTVLDRPAGVELDLPEDLVLESRQAGGSRTNDAMTVGFDADRRFSGGTVTLALTPRYALDTRLAGKHVLVAVALDPDASGGLVEASAASIGAAPSGLPAVLGLLGACVGGAVGHRRRQRASR